MKFTNVLSLITVVALLLCAVPLTAFAEDDPPYPFGTVEWMNYECADGVGYTKSGDTVKLCGYMGEGVETLTFPSEIAGLPVVDMREMGFMTFYGREYPEVRRLVIPEGVKYIGTLSLQQLPNLEEIVLPQSLQRIEEQAFIGATGVTDITIPAGVMLIADGVPFEQTVTLHGDAGSYAEGYAADHGLAFEPIVYEPSLGDVNADGVCNSTDARLILQYSVGKITPSEDVMPFADVDADSEITSTDARLCLQYAVGKEEVAGITAPTAHTALAWISPQAEVYVEVRYAYTLSDGREIPTREKERVVANRTALIREANRILAESYRLHSGNYNSIITLVITFENPDGTTVVFQRQRDAGGHLYVAGGVYNHLPITSTLYTLLGY